MSEDKLHITRRKVLGSLGAVGIGAGATGLGTTAFLSDTETFDGNTTTAGTLDLKVDWQQHYYGADGHVYVNAHPDHDGDGRQSVLHPTENYAVEYTEENLVDYLTCDTEGFDDDYDYTGLNDEQDALVQLDDVKPGDYGEITFSLHLCGNPGQLWMGGSAVDEDDAENGYAEPEPTTAENGDTQDPGQPDGRGELAENVEVEMWYDHDCNNAVGEGEEADIVFTLDASGSMFYEQYGGVVREESITVADETRPETTKIDLVERGVRQFLMAMAGADVQVGVVFFDGFDPDDGSLNDPQLATYSLQDPGSLDGALGSFRDVVADLTGGGPTPADGGSASTGTALTPGIEEAQNLLANGQSGVRSVNIVLTDGEPYRGGSLQNGYFDEASAAAADARADGPAPPTDVYVIGDQTSDARAQDLVLDMAGPAESAGADRSHLFDLSDDGTIPRLFQQVALLFLPEEGFFDGTLAEALDALESGDGIPLDSNRFVEGRDYYLPEMTQCIGFSWELPAEVGNEVQGDAIAFDLGFYGEQARHNGETAD